MAKLSKKGDKIATQIAVVPDRDNTWVSLRPVVFVDKKKDIKRIRQESKVFCRT